MKLKSASSREMGWPDLQISHYGFKLTVFSQNIITIIFAAVLRTFPNERFCPKKLSKHGIYGMLLEIYFDTNFSEVTDS